MVLAPRPGVLNRDPVIRRSSLRDDAPATLYQAFGLDCPNSNHLIEVGTRINVETSTGRSHQLPRSCAPGTGERQFWLTGPHPL
jgi:hypothetical protein